jgi:hypothetical protein
MLKAAKVSFSKMKKNIFVFGVMNCVVYIILFMSFSYFNLLHLFGLRMLNYVTLFLLSLYQIQGWIKQTGGYIPSLEAFGAIFFTGALSCLLFGGCIFIYSLVNPYVTELYFNTYGKLNSMSSAVIFFEGIAGSIIVALIAMMYSDRYEDGEAKL